MAGLEAPHSALRHRNRTLVADRVRIDVAGGGQARAQQRHALMAVAEPQHADRRNLRPAAAVDDRGIALDGLFGGLRGRARDGRHRCFRHMDGAGRLVELLPERAALGVTDQRIQSRHPRPRPARRRSGGGERSHAEPKRRRKARRIGPRAISVTRFSHRMSTQHNMTAELGRPAATLRRRALN